MCEQEPFGAFAGEPVDIFTLVNAQGARAQVMTWGAALVSLELPVAGGVRNVVLGFRDFADYPVHSPYFGATVGRFANRIGNGRLKLDGQRIELDRNEGAHHLHGGSAGLGRRVWQARPRMNDDPQASMTFAIESTDGDQGYPGNLQATCTYVLGQDNSLRIEMQARCDRPCPVNLAHHSYWNLDGGGLIDRHSLELEAAHFLPTDSAQIPTGEVASVAGTPFDFRQERRLDHAGIPLIDHAFIVADGAIADGRLRRVARLASAQADLAMELYADQPAVQVYTGFKLDVRGSRGELFPARAGLCLETEQYPDAPNRPSFPDCILRPGQVYRHVMEHRFEAV